MAKNLERESDYFRANRGDWVDAGHEGKWVVLRVQPSKMSTTSGVDLVGFFTSLEVAYLRGFVRFGDQPFLVKRVTPTEQVETIHRGI